MTPGQIMEGLASKNMMLTQKNDEYLELAEKRAQAERGYNLGMTAKILALKADGNSVTLISQLAKGDKVVADLKFKFDIALAVEKACLESIKNIRGAIDTYRSLLAWLKAEMTAQ
jgi:hypothetical protein